MLDLQSGEDESYAPTCRLKDSCYPQCGADENDAQNISLSDLFVTYTYCNGFQVVTANLAHTASIPPEPFALSYSSPFQHFSGVSSACLRNGMPSLPPSLIKTSVSPIIIFLSAPPHVQRYPGWEKINGWDRKGMLRR